MKRLLLTILRVPEQPALPPGPPGSIDCFRASRRYLAYSVLKWGIKQLGALFSLLISLAFLTGLRWGPMSNVDLLERMSDEQVRVGSSWFSVEMTLPDLLSLIEIFAIFAFVVQLVVSGLLLKLAWELRWYMVSDTTIRIREGLLRLKEQTMTVANIQNLSIRQGPLQRLFGIYDLEVETAGGSGGVSSDGSSKSVNLHVGHFRGLRDAESLRRRLRRQLAVHQDAGLGDPDEDRRRGKAEPSGGFSTVELQPVVLAAQRLLAETKALRGTLGKTRSSTSAITPDGSPG